MIAIKRVFKVSFLSFFIVLSVAQFCHSVILQGNTTSIKANSERLISYRHQEHMWMTSDGRHHAMMNVGSVLEAGVALNLYSQIEGANWQWEIGLENSTALATSDGYLESVDETTDVLHFVYHFGSNISYKKLQYDLSTKEWSTIGSSNIDLGQDVRAINPSVTVDANNVMWIAFVRIDEATNIASLQLYYLENEKEGEDPDWNNTGLHFGSPFMLNEEDTTSSLSAKLLREDNGVSMAYTNVHDVNWVERLNDWELTREWVGETLLTHQPPYTNDPYASHFSALIDSNGNRHLTFIEQKNLYYLRNKKNNEKWEEPQEFLTENDYSTAYVQISEANERLFLVANVATYLAVLESSDNGQTFNNRFQLIPPSANTLNDVYYSHPRVETPGFTTADFLPVFQQYVFLLDDELFQSVLYYEVPTNAIWNDSNILLMILPFLKTTPSK